jgi:pyruvate kinase
MRKAKIIATIGPACEKPAVLARLIKAGLNVCRLNFSFGTHEEHLRKIKNIRDAADAAGKAVAIMQDLQGPKIRMGKLNGPVTVKRGDEIILSGDTEHKSEFRLPTTYRGIASDTEEGKTILVADGKIILHVLKTVPKAREVRCKVVSGGTIITGKGINLPYTKISLPALTEKDAADAIFGIEAGVDIMALSFVRTAEDVLKLRNLMRKKNALIPIVAKLEKPEALDNLEPILDEVEGVMVARGDLADEISFASVPVAQKKIIHAANKKGKVSIIATEMLSSMIESPLPTRAEVSDVANGIIDGADALMLSNETAMGKDPVNAVKTMARIIEETEEFITREHNGQWLDLPETHRLSEAMCSAAAHLSYKLSEKAIALLTNSGLTALVMSKSRPDTQILAATCSRKTYNRMAILHNVRPIFLDKKPSKRDEDVRRAFEMMEQYLLGEKILKKGDRLIVLSGFADVDMKWNLNTISVVTLG